MILYHGSDISVPHPDVLHSKGNLDFGTGFYTTSNEAQAQRWARRKAFFSGKSKGVVNSYEVKEASSLSVLDFGEDLDSWIDFVCACRNGEQIFRQYDVISGKVADDTVFRVVGLYLNGVWEKERAIREMRAYETYNQTAFISQRAIDELLSFQGSYEVTL